MNRNWLVAAACVTMAWAAVPAVAAGGSGPAADCTSGVHTLSHFGDHVYPETGNGGYRSLHTDVHMVYDAASNRFLTGNHVVMTNRATQCLTDFSLDFERHSGHSGGPDLRVQAVHVNGAPATFRFVQPTYPGDPKGQNDPDPRAHQASQVNPVGGPLHNPLPPACTPQLAPGGSANSQNGEACPANKLVVTPSQPLRAGATFTVTVDYTGRPGVHQDGDGTTDGWFRSNSPAGDGGLVDTEPVGSEDWMPLNDHPSAKPTYDFYDTVNRGKTAIGNGVLLTVRRNAPDAEFPAGSTSFHWRSAAPVASYLVENSVGSFDLTERVAPSGLRFYEAQASSLSASRKKANLAIMDQQQDITRFQSQFNGPYPFTSAGVLVGLPDTAFEEEMQTMIVFYDGTIDLDIFHHENMHQWWGDHVTEANYDMTFFKEGLATLGEYLFHARNAEAAAGGPATPAGRAAFEASLIHRFDSNYAKTGWLWRNTPSDPTPFTLFSGNSTYDRPGTAYLALRQVLGHDNFSTALRTIQRDYGNASITEPQLEAEFARQLPNRSTACQARLGQFFTQWFDTAYPTAAGVTKPAITGPGLSGENFYQPGGGC